MKKKRNKKSIKRMIAKAAVILFGIASVLVYFTDNEVKADAVTDYLGVYVGYSGMELDEYVEVGDWHFSELEPYCYEENYSFMDYKGGDTYRAIVDSAYGIPIYDLLTLPDLSNINPADIMSVKFFVVAEGYGIRTAFDFNELFREDRYYFNDLASHREIIYKNDDTYLIDHYDFEEAWTDCYQVEPMLALEDNWAQFNEEHEHIGPDFSNLTPGTRFRLLFGQTEPTESQTGLSDKYVRYVYVTLYGSPSFGEMPEIDGSLGAHTAKATVSTQNGALSDALDTFMNIYSTNEGVLRINNVRVEHNDPYNADLTDVYIDYEIVGEGQAGIYGTFGRQDYTTDIEGMINQTMIDTDDFITTDPETDPETDPASDDEKSGNENKPAEQDPDVITDGPGADNKEGSASKDETSKEEKDKDKEKEKEKEESGVVPVPGSVSSGGDGTQFSDPGSTEKNVDNNTTSNNNSKTDNTANENTGISGDNALEKTESDGKLALADGEQMSSAAVEGKTLMYQLTGDAAGKLKELLNPDESVVTEIKTDKDVTEVKLEDKTDEHEARRKMILLITGLGCLGLCIIGAIAEYLSFKFRLKKSMKEELVKIKNHIGKSAGQGAQG